MSTPLVPQTVRHGNLIFVYSNIRTNQVVYSLSRAMKNNDALKQLPFLGKKSVPAALRKDLWTPLCLVEFPTPDLGLSTYRKLREYRRLHELAYPLASVTQTEGKHAGQLLPKKQKAKVLMNQKANSIADLAASLLRYDDRWRGQDRKAKRQAAVQEREDDRRRRVDELKAEVEALKEKTTSEQLPQTEANALRHTIEELVSDLETLQGEEQDAKEGLPPSTQYDGPPPKVPKFARTLKGTMIRWADLLDAEYAETWPRDVVHASLMKSRYTAAFPAMDLSEADLSEGTGPGAVDGSSKKSNSGNARISREEANTLESGRLRISA